MPNNHIINTRCNILLAYLMKARHAIDTDLLTGSVAIANRINAA